MLIIANWKAYVEDANKAKKLLSASKRLSRLTRTEIVLAPSAPLLGILSSRNKSKVAFAAQDISVTTGGARTGELTAQAFAGAGAEYAIIGHSERRSAGDTDTIVLEKLSHALAHGLTPILCVGEHERDNEGRYLTFVREQITSALFNTPAKDRSKVIIAYEPVWAIGKSAEDAIEQNDLAEMISYIRKVLTELLPGKSSARALVLYGGSIETTNVRDLAASTGIDGLLIGHSSVDLATFVEIVKQLV